MRVLAVLAAGLALGLALVSPALAQQAGRSNFILRCAGCHATDGSGSEPGGIPDFRNYVGAFAQTEDGRRYLMHVPGVVSASLTDKQIADVMNYVMETWGGTSLAADHRPFTGAEVTTLRAEPVGDVVAYRRKVAADLLAQGIATAGYPWP
ncbi:cytochrome c [Devosia sp. LjRoot16]|uniref:c-type cytochrome n=1 Tax=Devosia sp. LjRoot16 TaxID=3342271 RepID=UPI003ED0855F